MMLQIINYPVEGTYESEQSKSPKRRGIINKYFRNPIKIQSNNFLTVLKSPKISSTNNSNRQQEIANSVDGVQQQYREHNYTFYNMNQFRPFQKSEQKNRFAIIKKVFKKEDQKDCLFLERKLSLLKFSFKEKEDNQKLSVDYSLNKYPQTAQSTRKQYCINTNKQQQLFKNKITRRFNSDSDIQEQKPNRKQLVSYSIRPLTHYNDRDHQQFAQNILDNYIKKLNENDQLD